MIYVLLDISRDRLCLTNAGHPPPLMITSAGQSTFLASGVSVPLGVDRPGTVRHDATYTIESGSYLLLYSDGLVENAARTITEGMEALLAATRDFRGRPEQLCDLALSIARARRDDICVLAVEVHGGAPVAVTRRGSDEWSQHAS